MMESVSMFEFPNKKAEYMWMLPIEKWAYNPLDFASIFPTFNKIEIEIGFSTAFFLSKYANKHPETALLGIEKNFKYFKKGFHVLERNMHHENVKITCFDAIAFLRELVPFNSLDAVHIYFPDPWPKRKQRMRRIVNAENIMMIRNRLKPNGKIYLATDHPDYGQWMKLQIDEVSNYFIVHPYDYSKREVTTKWEEKQRQAGWNIHYFLLEKP